MGSYTKLAMRLFYPASRGFTPFVSELRNDLKRSRLKLSVYEYLSISFLSSFIILLITFTLLTVVISMFLPNFILSLLISLAVSGSLSSFFFLLFLNYPKSVIREKSKRLEDTLPFAALYLSTIAGSKLPLNKIFTIFSKFGKYGEISDEVNSIINDIELFGVDINTSVERAIERSPSKNFKELLWGILSMNKTGGDMYAYLREKGKTFLNEYRRRLFEFSHQLTIFIEIYLTAIVLGAIFFTILTAIISGLSGVGANIIVLQFFLIVIFLPVLSLAFILIIKSITPGGEF